MSCSDRFLLQRVFGVLDFSAWFLAILPAALLRRTQEKQLSFATFLFCFGKRKVEDRLWQKKC
jgi:hypothetical protein